MTTTPPQIQRRYDDDDEGVDVSTVIIAFICIGLVFLFIVLPMSLCCYCNYKRKSRAVVATANLRIIFPHIQNREVETGRREESQSPDERLSIAEHTETIPLADVPPPPYKERDEGGDAYISLPTYAHVSPRAMEDAETDWGRDLRSVFRQPPNATQ